MTCCLQPGSRMLTSRPDDGGTEGCPGLGEVWLFEVGLQSPRSCPPLWAGVRRRRRDLHCRRTYSDALSYPSELLRQEAGTAGGAKVGSAIVA
jgi:hypothetical protein